MAYVTETRTPRATLRERAVQLFAGLGERLAQRRVYRTTLNELANLTDRELRDLGVHRSAIKAIAHEAAYGK